MLGAYVWRLDTLVFDPHPRARDAAGVQWIATQVEGFWGAPATDAGYTARPAAYGAYRSPAWRKQRTISLTGRAYAPDFTVLESCKATVSALCPDPELAYQLVCDTPLGQMACQVHLDDDILVEPLQVVHPAIEFSLQLVAPDPRKYLTTGRSTATTLATTAPGGAQWYGPAGTTGAVWNGADGATGMVWQEGSGTVGRIILVNDGTAPTPVQFTVTGPATDPSIVDITHGHTITYSGDVPAGSTLAIDTGPGSVRLDGINQGARLSRAEFFTVPARSAIDVAFRAATTSSPSALLAASWADAYL